MAFYKDQTGRAIEIQQTPQRIVSLVPSQTELLFSLGLNEQVIGITKFCIHPAEWLQTKTIVGGTKDFKTEVIHKLQPDLIIANKEENDEKLLINLMASFPVWISDINNLESSLSMIETIGEITNTKEKAIELTTSIKFEFNELENFIRRMNLKSKRVAYFIWNKPLMGIGQDTFIADMLRRCGLQPVFLEEMRYPEISASKLVTENPELVFLSSEPYPFKPKHILEFSQILPTAKFYLVNGEYFSWYGSRLKKSPTYFKTLLNTILNE